MMMTLYNDLSMCWYHYAMIHLHDGAIVLWHQYVMISLTIMIPFRIISNRETNTVSNSLHETLIAGGANFRLVLVGLQHGGHSIIEQRFVESHLLK